MKQPAISPLPAPPASHEETLETLLENMSHLEEVFLASSLHRPEPEKPEEQPEQVSKNAPGQGENVLVQPPVLTNLAGPISQPGSVNSLWKQPTAITPVLPLSPVPLAPPVSETLARFAPMPVRSIVVPRRSGPKKGRPVVLLIALLLTIAIITGASIVLTGGSVMPGSSRTRTATPDLTATANGYQFEVNAYGTPVSPTTTARSSNQSNARPGATSTPVPPGTTPGTSSGSPTPTTQPGTQPTTQPGTQPTTQPTTQPVPQPTATPTPLPPVTVAEGVNYELVNRNSGLAMEVSGGSGSAGSPIDQASFGGNTYQLWHFFSSDNGSYVIVNQRSHLALAETGTSGGQLEQVSLRKNGDPTQQWLIKSAGGGYLILTNAASGEAVDVAQSSVIQNTPQGGASQQWTLVQE